MRAGPLALWRAIGLAVALTGLLASCATCPAERACGPHCAPCKPAASPTCPARESGAGGAAAEEACPAPAAAPNQEPGAPYSGQ